MSTIYRIALSSARKPYRIWNGDFGAKLRRADFESGSCTDRIGFFATLRVSVNNPRRGEGGTALYGLYVDVPMDRAPFFDLSVLNRVYNFVLVCRKQGM